MEQFFSQQKVQAIKEARCQSLLASLTGRRIADKCDIVLVCGGKEFPAHRLILEASSSYFEAMFHSGLEEAKSGKVLFKEMEPDTLEAILDFIYLGNVEKIKTENHLKRVLAASHMMHLEQLAHYCCDALGKVLLSDNVLEIWDIAKKYENHELQTKVLNHWIMNATKLVTTTQFLCMTAGQVKDFVCFLSSKLKCLDKVLLAVTSWLRHDLVNRDTFCRELFISIDSKRLSKQCMKGLLENKSSVLLTTEMANRMKELAVDILLNWTDSFCINAESLVNNIVLSEQSRKITFFSDSYIKEEFDPKQLCPTKREETCSCIQQFDLDLMIWLPLQKVPIMEFGSLAICQYGSYIYMVGGSLGAVYAAYDVKKNIVEYLACAKFTGRQGAKMCCFKDHLYVVGGKLNGESVSCVHFALPGSDEWFETNSLTASNHKNFTTVLSSTDYIYIASCKSPNEFIVEYSARSEVDHFAWKSLNIPNIGEKMHLFVLSNTLHCLYCDVSSLVVLRYNHPTNRWVAKQYPRPQDVTQVTGVGQCPNNCTSFVFLTTESNNVGIPNYLWEPESGRWTKLPSAKGQRTIPDNHTLLKVYTVGV